MLTKNNNLSGKFQGLPISRMGITDKNEGRILAIVYMYDQIFDSALKGIDPSYLAKEISDFYVYEVDTGYGKKYVHIEKDDTVSLTSKPTFFVDALLIETSNMRDALGHEDIWKKSNYYDEYGMYSRRKISYSERPVHLKD